MPDRQLPYFGHSWAYDCSGLNNVPQDSRPSFLICLYFTVLVDQAMYTHYPHVYTEFEKLTKYPKFCHGLGQFQKNPRDIISVPVEKGLVDESKMTALLPSGMDLFVDEVVEFFTGYMQTISAIEFFDKLLYDSDVQIPLIVTMLNSEMKNDIVVLAYEAMKDSVKRKLKNG